MAVATTTDAGTKRPLATVRASLAGLAGSFDASALSDAELESVITDAVAICSMAGTLKAKAARAQSTRSPSSSDGHRSAAHRLAELSGSSRKEAQDELKTAEVMEKHRELDDAASSGKLSVRQASLIARVAEVNPSALESLIGAAQGSSLCELTDLVARARAAGDGDPEATRARLHRGRSLRSWSDTEGFFHLHLKDTPDRGAEVLAALDPLRDQCFDGARRSGRREPPNAYGADALVELARRSLAGVPGTPGGAGAETADAGAAPDETTGAGGASASADVTGGSSLADPPGRPTPTPRPARRAPAKIIVRVDYETLCRGYPVGDELCEVAGVGPISPQAVAQWLLQPDSFMAAVVTKAKRVAGVVHFGRQPTVHQRTALAWLHATCSVEGCGARAHLEIDHILDWSISHRTKLEDLGPLCHFHHKMKTEKGWMLVDGIGTRAFVAPEDPRHPLFNDGKAGWRPRYAKYRAPGRGGPGGAGGDGGAGGGGGDPTGAKPEVGSGAGGDPTGGKPEVGSGAGGDPTGAGPKV